MTTRADLREITATVKRTYGEYVEAVDKLDRTPSLTAQTEVDRTRKAYRAAVEKRKEIALALSAQA